MSTPDSCAWCGKPGGACFDPYCEPFLDGFRRRNGYDIRDIKPQPCRKRVPWRKQEVGLGVLRCPRDPDNERQKRDDGIDVHPRPKHPSEIRTPRNIGINECEGGAR